ncbi:MAG TPA: Asp23/Gls24 family envelope stress response protein [Chlamydiales bacterium]|nr:Asp23/Gls24 family envelope stress response protein [Chlamydiales bacterium]
MTEETFTKIDSKEIELPDTIYSRDIEGRVFQGIVLQTLAKIYGISLLGGTLIDNLLGRDVSERIKGITVEQDLKKHSVFIRVEVNIEYGISIPAKAEEIQSKILEEISNLTGLHVSCVHVVFKNLIMKKPETEEGEEHSQLMEEVEENLTEV